MTPRFRQLTAILLLTSWPLVLGLATGWHTHSHGVHCERESGDTVATCRHHHSHGGVHHHHIHDHGACESETAEKPGNSPFPRVPDDSEDCHSCRLLALSGVVTQSLPELPALPFCDSRAIVSVEVPDLELLDQFHLRGPPAEMTV